MTSPLLPMDTTAEQPPDLHPDIEGVLVSEQQIADKIAELAKQIETDYADREVMLVGVLKGAVMVMADLA
ncbi:MAG: tRNA(Ile)-lysidine synthase, partial [Frankiaceae bacterium]|nr:tRNA(Ile)-lysidine synthase [Frankiaceae bacterium]